VVAALEAKEKENASVPIEPKKKTFASTSDPWNDLGIGISPLRVGGNRRKVMGCPTLQGKVPPVLF